MRAALIVSLCDFTGNWSRPYEEAGYDVLRIDLAAGRDVRLLEHLGRPVHGILAAPPCTAFSRAGARWWAAKGPQAVLEGLAVVDACLRAVALYRPAWWCLENPIGRLQDYLGPPAWKFHPCDYGDGYTKRTWLWGQFTPPTPLNSAQARRSIPIALVGRAGGRDRTTRLPGRDRVARSATPPGFARAFYEANP